ncbi:hypothetical protein DOTSEDRAFT_20530 [Dothistroma septosporum NZE10]|uniref:Uncharacterized protein n=1 Tax=Dothistroma septosporum (strain NZE10 / CBS 128990) TaxID=675120 RepID=N1Q4D0_DOTSN|nr:hypothetical protein DOTSEDRAFT_20530 [Dothistroma septosporum NZE10]
MAPPQWCRTTENIEFMPLRHCVFRIESASANFTSRIIFNNLDSRNHLYKLLNDFHYEFSDKKPGAADELRQLIKDARQQWAIQLRDGESRDIEVVVEHEYFGNGRDAFITARFKAIKQDLVAVGGDFYHHFPYDKDTNRTALCVVVPQAGLEAVLTEKRMTASAITFKDITAPAARDCQPTPPNPGCQFWYRNANSSITVLPTPKDTIRARSNTLERAIVPASPAAWDPYSRPQTVEQQVWQGRKPFSAEVYEPESNYNWIERDFYRRCRQLDVERISSFKSSSDEDESWNMVKNIKVSRNGSTIWEEPFPCDDLIIGKPPSQDEGTWQAKWTWIQRMIAGSGRRKPSPATTKSSPGTPSTIKRCDSAVSFSAAVAPDVVEGILGDRRPGQAGAELRQILDATGVPRSTAHRPSLPIDIPVPTRRYPFQ